MKTSNTAENIEFAKEFMTAIAQKKKWEKEVETLKKKAIQLLGDEVAMLIGDYILEVDTTIVNTVPQKSIIAVLGEDRYESLKEPSERKSYKVKQVS